MRLTKTFFVVCLDLIPPMLILSGCAMLSSAQVVQQGDMIAGCQNVQSGARVEAYDTKFYRAKFQDLTNPKPFCKAYIAEGKNLPKIVATIVPKLGNRILVFDIENGVFTTDFAERGSLERL